MSRSLKKPFYCPESLRKAVLANRSTSERKRKIETRFRSACILPEFVGLRIGVHNGRTFIPVVITSNMIGHKLGEFSPTRIPASHGGDKKATRR